jgi:hypothetical protein
MVCGGSPTDCATRAGTNALVPPAQTRAAATQFEALLFESALRPLADALGFYGGIVTGALAEGIAQRSHGAVESAVERALAGPGR